MPQRACQGCFFTHCLNNEEHSPQQTGCSAETQLQILHAQKNVQWKRSAMLDVLRRTHRIKLMQQIALITTLTELWSTKYQHFI